MRRFIDWIVSDRVVMAVIVLNATALVLHEMMMDNTESLERKMDALTEEVRRLRDDLGS